MQFRPNSVKPFINERFLLCSGPLESFGSRILGGGPGVLPIVGKTGEAPPERGVFFKLTV